MCHICSGRDSGEAQKNFELAIAQLGGKILGTYQGKDVSVECECPEGHKCKPSPGNIQRGQGMCSSCGFKTEPLCRAIFEEILQCSMPKVHPPWLPWKNGRCLELDGYNEKKKIAFEYQGIQHTEYVPHFHRNGPEDLEDQQERDTFKAEACREQGVRLICVPCTYSYRDPEAMRKYILSVLTDI